VPFHIPCYLKGGKGDGGGKSEDVSGIGQAQHEKLGGERGEKKSVSLVLG